MEKLLFDLTWTIVPNLDNCSFFRCDSTRRTARRQIRRQVWHSKRSKHIFVSISDAELRHLMEANAPHQSPKLDSVCCVAFFLDFLFVSFSFLLAVFSFFLVCFPSFCHCFLRFLRSLLLDFLSGFLSLSFLSYFLPSFLPSFPSFLPSFLPSVLHSVSNSNCFSAAQFLTFVFESFKDHF